MKQWIYVYVYVSAILMMIAVIWNSIVEKVIPGITYIEMMLSGMIVILLVYLPILIKTAENETYKNIKATFIEEKGWMVDGIENRFFLSEGHILNYFAKEKWRLKGVIGTDQPFDKKEGEKKRYYYLYKNW